MFGSKKDPLVDVVKKVMEGNEVRRQVERDLNTELGIYSRQVLPNEYHSRYDSILAEKTQIALNEELKGNQTKIDLNKNNKIDREDLEGLRNMKEASLEEGDSDKGTSSGAVTDMKTGKKVPSGVGAKPVPPPKPTAPRYSGADKNALDQKFVAAATEVLKPTSTPAAKAATPAKPMSDKEALDQKFKDAAAELDEALTGKGKLGSIYQRSRKAAREASTQDDTDENNRKATRAAGMMSNIAAKKAVDTELEKYGKKRSQKMPYKGPKYKKSMEEESLDEARKAMASYIPQAASQAAKLPLLAKDAEVRGDESEVKRLTKKFGNRMKFIRTAAGKLAEEDNLDEMAPKGYKYERMIKHIKAKYSKNGLTDDEKSIAYATAQKAKNKDSK